MKNKTIKCHEDGLYWFDSNDQVQDLFESCADENQCTANSCQNDQCVNELKCDGSTCSAASEDYLSQCGSSAAVSESPFLDFLKDWWRWILIAVILAVLFVVLFRRFSNGKSESEPVGAPANPPVNLPAA